MKDSIFQNLKVTSLDRVNQLCDQIVAYVSDAFPDAKSDEKVLLSGRLSKNLQEAKNDPLENIVFITSKPEVYTYCCHQLPRRIKPNGLVIFKNRILLYFDAVFIEIWYSELSVNEIMITGISHQAQNEIPEETL